MSYHVKDIAAEEIRLGAMGFHVAQRVETVHHTSPYLCKIGRKYKYTIFATRNLLGFDLKLIQRVERNAQ